MSRPPEVSEDDPRYAHHSGLVLDRSAILQEPDRGEAHPGDEECGLPAGIASIASSLFISERHHERADVRSVTDTCRMASLAHH
jgi:hypothetical protein